MFNQYVDQQIADAYRASREREAALLQQLEQIDHPTDRPDTLTQIVTWFAEMRWFRPLLDEGRESHVAGNWLDEPSR